MIVDHRWEMAKDVRVPGYRTHPILGINVIQRLGDYVDLKDSRNFWNGEPVYVNVRITETLQTTSVTVPKSIFLLLASSKQYEDGIAGDEAMTVDFYDGSIDLRSIGQTAIINAWTYAGTSFVFPVSRPHMTYRFQEQYGPLDTSIDAHDLRYLSVAHLYDQTMSLSGAAEWNTSGRVTVSLSLEGADVPRTYPASTST